MNIALMGAGDRGFTLARLVRRQAPWAPIVAVAEPRPEVRAKFAREFGLAPEACFQDWRALMASNPDCQAAIIATLDKEHRGPAEAALAKGWHLLLEKPLAPNWEDCLAMAEAWRRSKSLLSVVHSLRYHKAFARAHAWIAEGRIGRLMSLDLMEQVGFWHYAHSFVRGNWAREEDATFILLAKSCHDMDLIQWFANQPCVSASSYGTLSYFTAKNMPEGAPEYCHQGCPVAAECPFDARKLYGPGGHCRGWTQGSADVRGCSVDEAYEAFIKGREGRCVYRCKNDVADHQGVLLRFADGLTATFTLTAFTVDCSRRLRLQGSEGILELNETDKGQRLLLRRFDGIQEELLLGAMEGSHGGGDGLLVGSWLEALRTGKSGVLRTGMEESLASHQIVFAAEQSRREGRMVEIKSPLAAL